MSTERQPTLEAAIARLESIAETLEDPETTLDTAVRLYEEGLALYRQCTSQLDAAELRITELSRALEQQGKGS
jgi:exodeoxyribonuclease VII small subunit